MAPKKQMDPPRERPVSRPQPKKPSLKLILVKQMVALSTSGFGLIAALAWNNVIQELVDSYIKPYLAKGSGLISLFIYAVLITILAVTVTYQLGKIIERFEPHDEV